MWEISPRQINHTAVLSLLQFPLWGMHTPGVLSGCLIQDTGLGWLHGRPAPSTMPPLVLLLLCIAF